MRTHWILAALTLAAPSLALSTSGPRDETAAPMGAAPPMQDEGVAQARQWIGQGRFAEAIPVLRAAVEEEPEDAQAWYLLGYCLHATGDLAEAVEVHTRASAFPSVRPTALYNLACAHSLLGNAEEGFAALESCLEAGFAQRNLLASDGDLAFLRRDPRMARFLPPTAERSSSLFAESPRVMHRWVGEGPGHRLGASGGACADLNGDGTPDLLLGASDFGEGAGKFYVFSGADGSQLSAVPGKPRERLGASVAAPGDLNGDGVDDVVVGAPGGAHAPGAVYVYSGDGSGVLRRIVGEQTGDLFGHAVAGVGDMDGDGRPDLAIGAPGCDSTAINAGRVYIHSGGTGELIEVLDGQEEGDGFGARIVSSGGELRLVVSAPTGGVERGGVITAYGVDDGALERRFDHGGSTEGQGLGSGGISILHPRGEGAPPSIVVGSPGGGPTGAGIVEWISGEDGSVLRSIEGASSGERFGSGVASIGDLDGDGLDEIAVGCPGAGEGRGAVRVIASQGGSPIRGYTCLVEDEHFGALVESVGDLNQDGRVELWVSSPLSAATGVQSGRSFVLSAPLPPGVEELTVFAIHGGGPAGQWDLANAREFDRARPEISIWHERADLYSKPAPTAYQERLLPGSLPDVGAGFIAGVLRDYVADGTIADLEGLWNEGGWDERFAPALRDLCSYDGKPYFVPQAMQWNPIWYRKDVFAKHGLKAPESWDELLDLCETLEGLGYAPFTCAVAGWNPPTARWFTYLSVRLHGAEFHERLMKGEIPYDGPEVRSIFEHWKQLFDHGAFAEHAATVDYGGAIQELLSGKAVMYNLGEWIFESIPAAQMGDLDFFRFPTLDPAVEKVEIVHAYGAFMTTAGKHPDEAREYMAWLASEASQASMPKSTGRLAAHMGVDPTLYRSDVYSRGMEFIRAADAVVPLFECNTDPRFVTPALNAFSAFFQAPHDVDRALATLEAARGQVFGALPDGER